MGTICCVQIVTLGRLVGATITINDITIVVKFHCENLVWNQTGNRITLPLNFLLRMYNSYKMKEAAR